MKKNICKNLSFLLLFCGVVTFGGVKPVSAAPGTTEETLNVTATIAKDTLEITEISSNTINFDVQNPAEVTDTSGLTLKVKSSLAYSVKIQAVEANFKKDSKATIPAANMKFKKGADSSFTPLSQTPQLVEGGTQNGDGASHSIDFQLDPVTGFEIGAHTLPVKITVTQP